MRPSTKSLITTVAAVAAACLPMAWLWGFTVDDALISGRVAHQLATGHGYRFNADGPIVDAVTPLGWAGLLAPFASAGPVAAVRAAKWLGALCWLFALGSLGGRLSRLSPRGVAVALLLLLSTTPLAAWVVSGMETGLVVALATLGLHGGLRGCCALGVAAALRPELAPWAVALGAGQVFFDCDTTAERVRGLALGPLLLPFIAVAVVRTLVFGAAYPLSVLAKPSDASSGLRYTLGALAFTGPAWLLLTVRSHARSSPQSRVIVGASLLHALVIVLVGGDWMPFYRLFMPVLPSMIWAGAELAQRGPRWTLAARLALALAICAAVARVRGPAMRGVEGQRQALMRDARPLLEGARRIATLDVGWVGASSSAHVVDLAGVTDPSVARLAGGHTTKRLPDGFLESREIDALVLLAEPGSLDDWPDLRFARGVEARVARLPGIEDFRPVGRVELRSTQQAYVIARKARSR
jgi:hypothetical protein